MNILITAGTGGIGNSLVKRCVEQHPEATVYATYKTTPPDFRHDNVIWLQADLTSENDVQALAGRIPSLDILINAAGFLHAPHAAPEKTILAFDPEFFNRNIQANTLPTLLLAKHFFSHLKGASPTFFVSLSARIGCIADNRIGGWISYRCAKAALNMAIKTLSIEWRHRVPNCCVIAFHPGTTDTRLSKPFQANIPPEKLFTPAYVAGCLMSLLGTLNARDTGQFFSFSGDRLPW